MHGSCTSRDARHSHSPLSVAKKQFALLSSKFCSYDGTSCITKFTSDAHEASDIVSASGVGSALSKKLFESELVRTQIFASCECVLCFVHVQSATRQTNMLALAVRICWAWHNSRWPALNLESMLTHMLFVCHYSQGRQLCLTRTYICICRRLILNRRRSSPLPKASTSPNL